LEAGRLLAGLRSAFLSDFPRCGPAQTNQVQARRARCRSPVGGEQQMWPSPGRFMSRPRLLLLDEPDGPGAPVVRIVRHRQLPSTTGAVSVLLAEQERTLALRWRHHLATSRERTVVGGRVRRRAGRSAGRQELLSGVASDGQRRLSGAPRPDAIGGRQKV